MKIDKKFVKHIGELSRIKLEDKEVEKFTPQMETILESVVVLKEVNTDDVSPMKRHVNFVDLRVDIPGNCLTQEDVLKNAKHSQKGMVKVYGSVFDGIEES